MKVMDSYFGGKGAEGTYQTIINQIPPHNVFISGFLGNCAVMRYKLPASKLNFGIDRDPDVIEAWKSRWNKDRFVFHNRCAMDFIESWFSSGYNYTKDKVFMYLDPPYPHATWKFSENNRHKYSMTDVDHLDLLSLIKRMPAMVAISTYDNTMYQAELKDWRKIQFESQTRRGKATETLYMNYPEPTELHDYRYLGTDFRERERIKKKVRRHVEKFRELPVLERNAIILEITKIK